MHAVFLLMTSDYSAVARDTRREGMLVGGTNKKKTVRYQLDVTAKDDTVSVNICNDRVALIQHYMEVYLQNALCSL